MIKKRMKKLVEMSKFTTLSSEGFLKFLPKSQKYKIVYSYNSNVIENAKVNKEFKVIKPIRISFIGNIRFIEINKELINALANDNRFSLKYYGTNNEELAKYAKEKKVDNIEFKGAFNIDETSLLLDETDIFNNLYGNNNIALDTALSIRMYYSLFLNKPILTTKNTYTAKEANKFKLGFEIDPQNLKNIGNHLYNWYKELNSIEINKKRTTYINKVISNNNNFYKDLKKIFNE
ncbi:hypothetical protein BUZ50_11755 [Staphylococcus hominis]|nr:hypothetical protein BUZ50_11755 [Staphylococcus hominis]